MSKHTEISRFSAGGKTFFFNKARARNGSPYLAINALYGKGSQERIILFEPHLVQFRRHLEEAIGDLTGATFASPSEDPTSPGVPEYCEACGTTTADAEIMVMEGGHIWLTCGCGADLWKSWAPKANDE